MTTTTNSTNTGEHFRVWANRGDRRRRGSRQTFENVDDARAAAILLLDATYPVVRVEIEHWLDAAGNDIRQVESWYWVKREDGKGGWEHERPAA